MQILMIAINDPAGTAIEFTKAINKYTRHTCRLITKEIRYNFMFEKDLHLPWLDGDGWDEVEDLLKTSDVFHFHMTADEYIDLGPFRPVDYIKGKIIVHHHHGHPDFRGNPEKYRQKYKKLGRKNLLVSTPDLLKLLPGARWQPNLVPIDDQPYTPMKNKPKEPVIICHSPTRKDLKNTDEFIYAVNNLKRDSEIPNELRLIENTPHKECLRLKRESHILFDHLQGYFGVSSLEGLSQGLCVIAGLDDWNRGHIEAFTGTKELPWVIANNGCLAKRLAGLIHDVENAAEIGKHSRSFMEKCWNPNKLANQLVFQIESSVKHPKNRQTPGAEKPSHCQRWDTGHPPKQ
jgi:hypothetical protein